MCIAAHLPSRWQIRVSRGVALFNVHVWTMYWTNSSNLLIIIVYFILCAKTALFLFALIAKCQQPTLFDFYYFSVNCMRAIFSAQWVNRAQNCLIRTWNTYFTSMARLSADTQFLPTQIPLRMPVHKANESARMRDPFQSPEELRLRCRRHFNEFYYHFCCKITIKECGEHLFSPANNNNVASAPSRSQIAFAFIYYRKLVVSILSFASVSEFNCKVFRVEIVQTCKLCVTHKGGSGGLPRHWKHFVMTACTMPGIAVGNIFN